MALLPVSVLPVHQAYAEESGKEVQQIQKLFCLGAGAIPRQVKSQLGRAQGQEKSADISCRFP